MALKQKQQELMGAYSVLPSVKTPWWNLFSKTKMPYLALSNVIKIDEVMSGIVEAGIVPRGTKMPSIKIDGHVQTTVTPDIIGGSAGINALDTLNANAGETVVVNGQSMKASKYDENLKLTTIKNGIENTKEKNAALAIINGEVNGAMGTRVNLALDAVEIITKTDATWVMFFTKLINDYINGTGKMPTQIFVGTAIVDAIISELEGNPNPNFKVTTQVNEYGSMDMILTGLPMPLVTFPPHNTGIDTQEFVFLINDLSLVPVYAGLEYVGTTGGPEMIRSEIISDTTAADPETGSAKLFAKSAPFPVIILPKLIKRYRVSSTTTLSTNKNSKVGKGTGKAGVNTEPVVDSNPPSPQTDENTK